jgi:hypothetical protein
VPPETALNRYKSAIRHHREKIARRVRELMGG